MEKSCSEPIDPENGIGWEGVYQSAALIAAAARTLAGGVMVATQQHAEAAGAIQTACAEVAQQMAESAQVVARTAEVEVRLALAEALEQPGPTLDAPSNGAAAPELTRRRWAIAAAAGATELAMQVSDLAAQAARHTTEFEVQMISLADAAQRLI